MTRTLSAAQLLPRYHEEQRHKRPHPYYDRMRMEAVASVGHDRQWRPLLTMLVKASDPSCPRIKAALNSKSPHSTSLRARTRQPQPCRTCHPRCACQPLSQPQAPRQPPRNAIRCPEHSVTTLTPEAASYPSPFPENGFKLIQLCSGRQRRPCLQMFGNLWKRPIFAASLRHDPGQSRQCLLKVQQTMRGL
ncbi:hypothetical protein DAEQUDRAFT_229212 [Daedalea quercina L-15889]|uniref:Uncharacterized protein n=1 Tax=Daedalea quercina L-15889 TaxID=1314783 RepID=A0A165R2Q2_9APHY|nr:hypothetical protein DAEQUDRAFT_229212 [Daedalea quercina L-15889]